MKPTYLAKPSMRQRRLHGMERAIAYVRETEVAHLSWSDLEDERPQSNALFLAVRELAADQESLFGFCVALHSCFMGYADGTSMDAQSLDCDVREYARATKARCDRAFRRFLGHATGDGSDNTADGAPS